MPKASRTTVHSRVDAPSQVDRTRTVRGQTSGDNEVECYLFKVHVAYVKNPRVERHLCVPSNFTFKQFASVLGLAFGWGYYDPGRWSPAHVWQFQLCAKRMLQNVRSILQIQGAMSSHQVEQIPTPGAKMLTLCMDSETAKWVPDGDARGAETCTLRHIFEPEIEYDELKDLKFNWTYDMGDNWTHLIKFLGVAPSVSALRSKRRISDGNTAFCYGGKGHGIAEDCGGPMCWEDLRKVLGGNAPEGEYYEQWKDWAPQNVDGTEAFDENQFSLSEINANLMGIDRESNSDSDSDSE